MYDTVIIILIIFLFLNLVKEKFVDPSAYLTEDLPSRRGSPNLAGWNTSTLYSVRPIIVDDLNALY
jgi:hypothetical protein